MISMLLSRIVIILFGTLYPAYASYKAVRTKNVKEYVKWMMYWIVYAIFTCIEFFADIFISWLPFYYEIKILIIVWLMLPATKGASLLYKKFIHPQLMKREEDIDQYIAKASDQGYSTIVTIGSKGFNYATNVLLATALKGQVALSEQMQKSLSLNDLSKDDALVQRGSRVESVDGAFVSDDVIDDDDDDFEKNDDDDFEKDDDDYEDGVDGDVELLQKEKKRRNKRHKGDLEVVDEHGADVPMTRARSRKKDNKAYDHTEVYHMGTLPKQRTKATKASTDTHE